MKNNALVLLWKGNNIPDYLVQKIAEVLTTNDVCIPEMLTIKVLDEDSVTNAMLRDTKKVETTEELEAVKHAVVYIGTRFAEALKGGNGPIGNIAVFAIELSNAVANSRRNTSFIGVGTKDELLTAIEIISTANVMIPSSLAKKYRFTQNTVDIIKKVYKSY